MLNMHGKAVAQKLRHSLRYKNQDRHSMMQWIVCWEERSNMHYPLLCCHPQTLKLSSNRGTK